MARGAQRGGREGGEDTVAGKRLCRHPPRADDRRRGAPEIDPARGFPRRCRGSPAGRSRTCAGGRASCAPTVLRCTERRARSTAQRRSGSVRARYAFSVRFADLALLPGHYRLRAHAMDPEGLRLFDTHEIPFVIAGATRELGYVRLPHAWPRRGRVSGADCGTRGLILSCSDSARAPLPLEFWLLPLAIALLPYRAGIELARWCAARLPLYDERARAGLAHYRAARPGGDAHGFLTGVPLHAVDRPRRSLLALTRSERFLLSRLDAPPRPAEPPLMVIGMHFGQGLWLLPWLRACGTPARFRPCASTRTGIREPACNTLTRGFGCASSRPDSPACTAIYTGGSGARSPRR